MDQRTPEVSNAPATKGLFSVEDPHIQLRGVNYTYVFFERDENSPLKLFDKRVEKQALFDVDLDIPRNQITAIIGSSGSGKSTVLGVISGLLEKSSVTSQGITSGKVFISSSRVSSEGKQKLPEFDQDGNPIRELVDIDLLKSTTNRNSEVSLVGDIMAVVQQKPEAFKGSIEEEVAFGVRAKDGAFTNHFSSGMELAFKVAHAGRANVEGKNLPWISIETDQKIYDWCKANIRNPIKGLLGVVFGEKAVGWLLSDTPKKKEPKLKNSNKEPFRIPVEYGPIVEQSLKAAGLWNDLQGRDLSDDQKKELWEGSRKLSVGQQQRLRVAAALAVKPEIMVLDESTSALDPISTAVIENTLDQNRGKTTAVMVSHNIQQAARLADRVVFMYAGRVALEGPTWELFNFPERCVRPEVPENDREEVLRQFALYRGNIMPPKVPGSDLMHSPS